jgi:hypothetical protein
MHKISWSQVPLPATTAFLVLNVFLGDNWDEKEAYVTDEEEVIHQNIHALFVKAKVAMAKFQQVKQIAWGKLKQQLEVPGQQAWRWPPPMPCEIEKKKRKLGQAE